ncbi:MAG: RpiB/LacA/LacB family sugar-phosphate isomerase [Malacoplasma sp.]
MAKTLNKKIVLLADVKNQDLAKKINDHIKKHKKFNIVFCKPDPNFINAICDNYKNHVYKNKNSRMIILDDYGALPFMVASKIPTSIVAELEDEHSAHMTMGHNNANVITLGSKILGFDLLIGIIDKYLFAKYEGGRHKVRLDMLTKMLEKEKI